MSDDFFPPPNPLSVAMGAALRAGRARGTHARPETDEEAEQRRSEPGLMQLSGGAGRGGEIEIPLSQRIDAAIREAAGSPRSRFDVTIDDVDW